MSGAKTVLLRALADEFARHEQTLRHGAKQPELALRALHSLKGSAGLAGADALHAMLKRAETRVRGGEIEVFVDIANEVRDAITPLRDGRLPSGTLWPEPPAALAPGQPSGELYALYRQELGDRLRAIDDSLASEGDPRHAVKEIYRHVHTIKGSASAAGDPVMAWFCHGLEDRLRGADDDAERAESSLRLVTRHRATLSSIVEDPETALASLRGRRPSRTTSSTELAAVAQRTGVLRVESAAIERLEDRVGRVARTADTLGHTAASSAQLAGALRELAASVGDALRLIGPPKPWGAPARAIDLLAEVESSSLDLARQLDESAEAVHGFQRQMQTDSLAARREITELRQGSIEPFLNRLRATILSEAARLGKTIEVELTGADITADRTLFDSITEACMHLVRNAVAHGIEPERERLAAGKNAVGRVSVRAVKTSDRLQVWIEDDGRGLDAATIRARAVSLGAISNTLAGATDLATLLSLIFVPGLSTASGPSELAGRGIGLDVALRATRERGGTLTVDTKPGHGFTACVDVPLLGGSQIVLWVEAGEHELGVLASAETIVRQVPADETPRPPFLGACLESRKNVRTPYAVRFRLAREGKRAVTFEVGVTAVGTTQPKAVRPLPEWIARIGPYAGLAAQDDGSPRLVVDPVALAARAHALSHAPAPSNVVLDTFDD